MQLKDLQAQVAAFRDAREWRRFHTPKNLAQALASEVGELNDLYLWDRRPDIGAVAPEIADIAIYLLSLCDVLGIDLEAAIRAKLTLNEKNYPVEKFKGSGAKK